MDEAGKRRKGGMICLECFVLISSVGKPLNTVLSRPKKNGKSKRFSLPLNIAFSPSDIQITLFFNLDKSEQSPLVTGVNSQS